MTQSSRVKINPDVLRWAREWFNMSTDDVARKMGSKSITGDTIRAWETGELQPTFSQLETLSEKLEKPLEVFLYPTVPDMPKPSAYFRSVYGEYTETLSAEILRIVSHTKNYQENLREITHGKNPSHNPIIQHEFSENIIETAETVRDILGVSLSSQKSIGRYDKAFEIWRNAFATAGIYVIKDAFGTEQYSGFCLKDAEFPVICINNSLGFQRQIFTLFHELYHLISKQNGVDIIDDQNVIPYLPEKMQNLERRCDEFAAEFLVPTDDFQKELENIPHIDELTTTGNYTDIMQNCILPLATVYCVSLDVILRKLKDVQYLGSAKYNQFFSMHHPDIQRRKETEIEPSAQTTSGGGSYYYNQVAYLGRPYIRLVMNIQNTYGMPDYVTAEYLGTTVKNLPRLIEAAMKGEL